MRIQDPERDGVDAASAKRRRRDGQSFFNGRRGLRNFLLLAGLCLAGFIAFVLSLPLEMQCSLLPESMCRGSCSALP